MVDKPETPPPTILFGVRNIPIPAPVDKVPKIVSKKDFVFLKVHPPMSFVKENFSINPIITLLY